MLKTLKLKSIKNYLFYIPLFLILCFLFYYIYNKYNQNKLRNNIIKKINNSYELFNNIENFSNNSKITKNNSKINSHVNIKKNKTPDLIEYSYYKSNKHDTYDMLSRDLNLINKEDLIEHMENQDLDDRFPDLNKSAFAMNENQSPRDLLVQQEFVPDKTQMSDALLNMDTRPDEQKELDSLLDDLNVYIYLLKNSLINDLDNKRDIAINQKISLYYNLFKDTKYIANQANNTYLSNKESPNYVVDLNLDKKVDLYLTNENNLSSSITTIYSNLLNKTNIEQNKDNLIKLNVPIPLNLDSEEEDNIVDPLIVIREFADNLNDMYDGLNTIIAPYYNFVFELKLAPYPVDDDSQDPNSPDNKAGAALIGSFMSEMLSFSSTYNDIMINYIMNENIYSLLTNSKNVEKILTLPNLSENSKSNLNELIKQKIITNSTVQSFDKSVQDITIIYNYFMSLYYLIKADPDPEKMDVDTIEKILKGFVTFNNKDRFSLLKKYNPTAENDQYTYAIKNVIANSEYIFVSLIDGFSTEKSIPTSPSKSSINKKKNDLAKAKEVLENAVKAAEKAAKEAAEAVEKAAKEAEKLAKETAEKAEKLAKEAAAKAAEEAKAAQEALEKAAKETERAAKEAAEKAEKAAKETAEKSKEAAKEIEKTANIIDKGAKDVAKDINKGAKNVGKKIGNAIKKIKF